MQRLVQTQTMILFSSCFFCTAAPISVSVTPPTTTVLDIQPNNRFSLTCIASTDFATAQKIFSWTKRVSGSLSSTPLTHNGGSVIITTTGQTSLISNSTLSTLETRAGTYVYTCSVSIGSSTAVTSDSTVTVRGTCITCCSIIEKFNHGYMFIDLHT